MKENRLYGYLGEEVWPSYDLFILRDFLRIIKVRDTNKRIPIWLSGVKCRETGASQMWRCSQFAAMGKCAKPLGHPSCQLFQEQ